MNERTSSPDRAPNRSDAGHADARGGVFPDPAGILESIGDVPYEWEIESDRLTWAPNAAAVLMIPDIAAISSGRLFAKFNDASNVTTRFDAIMRTGGRDTGTGVPYQVEYALCPIPGADMRLWVEDTGRWFAGPGGRPQRAHGVVRVINERHARDERLAYLSQFDALTGEMNGHNLTAVLAATLEEAMRYRTSCGFLLVAIDDLTRVNECYGYDVADELIAAVAKRLRAKMRGGDVLGRFSGNKFGVVLKSATAEDMVPAADRLLASVRDDVVQTAVGPVAATISIGGVAAPRHARTVAEILARAQESLNQAKAKRRGSFLAYRPSVEREAMRRENIRSTEEIVSALNDRRVLLAFEPIVDTRTRDPLLYECLMRIRSGDALLDAGEVIPMAEKLALVRLIDHRVLDLAVAELAATPNLHLSINASTASTADADWWASLTALLRNHTGVAERMTVEITEMAAIHDIDETRGFVHRVKDLGARIAIDDFGAGATSFRNLRRLGVDIVKIDGAFVQNIERTADDRAFVRAILDLAHALGLKTVAERVQTESAAAMLAEWGCDCLQGALIGLASVDRPWMTPANRTAGAA